jgi:hypothetical protein
MILTDFLDRFLESSRDARCYTQHEIFTPTIVYLIQPVLEFQKMIISTVCDWMIFYP